MKRTDEQLAAEATFTATVYAADARLRITADAEGWPLVLGRHGQIEWTGTSESVAIYTTARRLFRPLLAIPGVRRHQTGDREIRALLSVDRSDFPASFRAAAGLMRSRRRQPMTAGRKAALDHGRRLFQPKGA